MRVFVTTAVVASLMVAGCVAVAAPAAVPAVVIPMAIPMPEERLDTLSVVPSTAARVVGDIRGIQLSPESGGERIEFSDVTEVRWGPTELVIAGTVDASGSLERRQSPTTSVPLEDLDYVIVREYGPGGSWSRSFLAAAAGSFAGVFVLSWGLFLISF